MSHLYVLCGCPGSGKTTWAHKHLRYDAYISRDEIRFNLLRDNDNYFAHEKEVFNAFVKDIVSALKNGGNVVADATHIHHASRAKLLKAIDEQYINYDVRFIFFDTCLAVCSQRNAKREGRARVPDAVIYTMFDRITLPTVGEFDNCIGVWIIRE